MVMTSLREVFDGLVGEDRRDLDPTGLLREHGFDLSDDDVSEALVNYAYSAPVEVAAHLQQYVMAHSPVLLSEPAVDGLTAADGLDLLTTAPAGVAPDPLGLDAPAVGQEAGVDPPGSVDAPDFGAGGAGDDPAAVQHDAPAADAAAPDDLVTVGSVVDALDFDPPDPEPAPTFEEAPTGDQPAGDGPDGEGEVAGA
jgi:hypothetical protein